MAAERRLRRSHDQPRHRIARFEPELRRHDLRLQTRAAEHALEVLARMAVAPTRADRVPRFASGADQLLDGEDEPAAGTQRILGSRNHRLERQAFGVHPVPLVPSSS